MSKQKSKRHQVVFRRPFIPGFMMGLGTYFQVVPTLFKYKLWPLQFIPAFMSLLISVGALTSFWFISGGLSQWIDSKVVLPWPEIDQAITSFSQILTFAVLALGFILVHKHIILVILSPLLGKLAEVTYRSVMQDDSTSPLTVPQAVSRGLRINFNNIIKEILINIGFLCCNIIPGFGQLIATVGIFLNQSRFMGYGLMDFPLEHKGLSVKESLRFVKYRAGCSTGVGAGYILLMLLPLLGWMFAPTFGTIAGTLVTIRELEMEKKYRERQPDQLAT